MSKCNAYEYKITFVDGTTILLQTKKNWMWEILDEGRGLVQVLDGKDRLVGWYWDVKSVDYRGSDV